MSRNQQKSGRVLSKSISLSETMADLAEPVAILIATWLIPHADDQGRMRASPRQLKAQVFPMIDAIGAADITAALQRMAAVGMVALYTAPDGTPLLQFLSWWKWNDGQRWIYPSNFPAPEGWQDRVRVNSKDVPQSAEVCGSTPQDSGGGDGGGGGEGVGEGSLELEYGVGVGAGDTSAAAADVTNAYCAAFGVVSSLDAQLVDDAMREYPALWIVEAITEAVKHNKRSWRYAETILQRWKREGKNNAHLPAGQSPGVEAAMRRAAELRKGDVNANA